MRNYNLSDELEKIMSDACEHANQEFQKEVSLEAAIYSLVDTYVLREVGNSQVITEFFSILSVREKARFTKCVSKYLSAADKKGKHPYPELSLNNSSIVLSELLGDVLKRADRGTMVLSKLFPTEGSKISTENFLYSVLFEETQCELVKIMSESFGLSADRFNTLRASGLVSEIPDFTGILKEKRITPPENSGNNSIEENNKERMAKEDNEFERAGESSAVSGKKADPNSKTPYLDQFSYDMTQAAKDGKYDPVIGRDREISQIIEILCCRKKNNAVLLGDPGCGKTAVVECLVQKIISKDVPREILGKRICSLDLNALVSGTKYRGEYEQRLQGIIQEVCSNPDIIVYVDEFHNLVGNGSSSGNGDGANILKPYLARGEFQCIGSTTMEEYRKYIERDGALKRRFQNVVIEEPGISDTIEILKNLRKSYTSYHHVNFPDEVVKACVEWSGRYVIDRFFPDKAIDCLDMAGSLAKLRKKIDMSKIEELESEIANLVELKVGAVTEQDFEKAATYKAAETLKKKELSKLLQDLDNSNSDPSNFLDVTLDDVAEVISKISKIPVDKIGKSDFTKLRGMKDELSKKVIGQSEAVTSITTSLQRNFLGLRDENKPIASLLLVGPTGVGKSLICKEIASEFFGSSRNLIRFDMGEFGERHEVTKLTGATASYVGYDDTPLLEQVRRNPYSVVLFDEIEKAAPEIYNIFLNILDEGTVTLGSGAKVDFKNTIIIFTGNIGTKELHLKGGGLGFNKLTEEEKKRDNTDTVLKAVKKQFKPEFINRLSGITVFNELGKPELEQIFDLELGKLSSRLEKKGFKITVTPEIRDKVISECDPRYGARDLQRGIVKFIENEVCQKMLEVTDISKISDIYVNWTDKVEVKFTDPKSIKCAPDKPRA